MRIRSAIIALTAATAVGVAVPAVPGTSVAAAGVEAEGASCAVPALPDAGSLPTDAQLPDPFERLDGSRIASRSDWTCRRTEIRK